MASSRRRFVSFTSATFASITYTKSTCNEGCYIHILLAAPLSGPSGSLKADRRGGDMAELHEVEERGHQVLSSSFEARSIGPFFSTWPLGFIGGAVGKKTRWAAWTPPVRQESSTLSAARSGEP